MLRMSAFAVVMVASLGLAFLTGASVSTGAKPVDEKKPDTTKVQEEKKPEGAKPGLSQKTAVFNMAAVMRDFRLAKYQVWRLNERKTKMSKDLIEQRNEYVRIDQELNRNPNHPEKEAKKGDFSLEATTSGRGLGR